MTGVRVEEPEIYGKRLQILKEAVPLAAKVVYLDIRSFWDSEFGKQARDELRKASQILEISLRDVLVEESTPSEYQRAFAEIAKDLRAGRWRDPTGIWRALNLALWLASYSH